MNRRKYGVGRTFCMIYLLFLMIFALCGCNHASDSSNLTQDDSVWHIYCINNGETKVVSEGYTMVGTDPEEQIEELLQALQSEPRDYTNLKGIPDIISLKGWTLEGNQLTLDFDANYSNLSGIAEILRRTAIVKTLCQMKEVEYVSFTIAGQPLLDSNAQPVGLMSSSDFIDNTGGEVNYTQTVKITLFFAGEDGTTLKQSRHQVEFDGTISLEELVIRQLIEGPLPEEEGLYPVLSEDVSLLKISKKDGTCYVDFGSAFLDKRLDVSDEVVIYSVVNSLTEISGINRVQFMINGELRKTYRENLAFDGIFERNLDLVETVN